jgi:hypothetical protein
MAPVNWRRVVLGGLVWALVYGALGGLAMLLFLGEAFVGELERLGQPLELTANSLIRLGTFGFIYTVAFGIATIWLYAAIRPRYGPGPKAAAIAAFAVWLFSIVASLSHLGVFGLASTRFIVLDLPTELIAMLVATLAGAWMYRE